MARIVIDNRESGTSTGRYSDKLVEYLHKLESDHEVVILAKPERLEYLRQLAPRFTLVETTFKEFTFGEQLGLRRQIEGLHPDLVHFCMVQQPVWYSGHVVTTMHDLTTTRFRNPAKNPIVFTVKQQVYKWINKKVAAKSDHILTASQFVKDDIVKFTGVNPDKITITYEAADFIADEPRGLQALHGDEFIMYVGRPQPHKNLARLVEAYAVIKESHSQLKLVLAGRQDAVYDRIANEIKAKHINDVVFTGFITDAQLRWLYENCRAYIFPSLSEGFGLPGLEAMQHGAPVVSSNATCLPEVYGQAAHYFDPLDVSDMAAKIIEVLDDNKLRAGLVRAGREQAKKYSWERMAAQTLAVYQSVLENR